MIRFLYCISTVIMLVFMSISPSAQSGKIPPSSERYAGLSSILFLSAFLFATAAFVTLIIMIKQGTASPMPSVQKENKEDRIKFDEPLDFDDEPKLSLQLCSDEKIYSTLTKIDADRANLLISDAMAKNLIKRDGETFYVEGSRRSYVSIGDISERFGNDETIDIISLLECGLISSDTGSITVTEEGSIDKPLKIYANDFTLTAVKMIALSGGEAYRAHTKKY